MKHNEIHGGKQWIHEFDNGYGLSVVCHDYSYGGKAGLFEAALFHDGEICNSYKGWDDVRGWLTFTEVAELIAEVDTYTPNKYCNHSNNTSLVY